MSYASLVRTDAKTGGIPLEISSLPRASDFIPAIDNDGVLFPVEKMDAHRLGMLHVAVSIFVFAGEELLIQRRAALKYHCGGLWANSCCTHPHWGEEVADAAARRIFEELGVSVPLRPTGVITYFTPVTQELFEHERVQIFQGQTDRAHLRLVPCSSEVMETRFVSIPALCAEVRRRPENFTPWLKIYLKRWDELGLTAPASTPLD